MAAALGSITSFGVQVGANGAGLTIERAPGRADSGQFDLDFSDLVEDVASAMAEEHRGFALFVDELQDVDHDTLAALVLAQHRAGQEGWPFYLIGAGLPSLQRVLSEARSYAERIFDYYTVGALPAPEAAAALVDPARRFDADYTAEALDAILVAAAGYPYFLQEFGRAIWDRALDNPFSLPDAEQAVDFGQERLDAGFYRSRWDRATRAERDFLRAMVPDDGGPSSSSTVAKRMGRTLSGNGPVRASLIGKGLVYAPEHGQVAYTVPGMHQFIERQHD
jgi:hypothetical protein